jgi:inosine-uridine nucleoside N-ribohydrolase
LRSVVIETDMAADDVMAILYLLNQRHVDVRAIAVDGVGEARCPTGARHALSLLALAGKPQVPVACGRTLPLQGAHAFPTAWRDFVDGFFGLPLPAEPVGVPAASAEVLLRNALQSAPGRVDVVTLGPPTELAAALTASPQLSARLRAITMMGGAVGVPGNANAYAEWNFYIDPRAVNVVLQSGAPVTIVPLDATRFVPLNAGVAGRLGAAPTSQFVQRLINILLPFAGYQFWDPLAAAVAVKPDVATYETKRLSAVENEGPDSGRLVETAGAKAVRVAVAADRARFESVFVSAFG